MDFYMWGLGFLFVAWVGLAIWVCYDGEDF
jgi:hypothetical protein